MPPARPTGVRRRSRRRWSPISLAEAGGRGHVAGPDPDGVGDVGRQGRIAEREQDREGDQAAAARHPVEDAGAHASQDDQNGVRRGHAAQEYGTAAVSPSGGGLEHGPTWYMQRGCDPRNLSPPAKDCSEPPFPSHRGVPAQWRGRKGLQMRGRSRIAAVGVAAVVVACRSLSAGAATRRPPGRSMPTEALSAEPGQPLAGHRRRVRGRRHQRQPGRGHRHRRLPVVGRHHQPVPDEPRARPAFASTRRRPPSPSAGGRRRRPRPARTSAPCRPSTCRCSPSGRPAAAPRPPRTPAGTRPPRARAAWPAPRLTEPTLLARASAAWPCPQHPLLGHRRRHPDGRRRASLPAPVSTIFTTADGLLSGVANGVPLSRPRSTRPTRSTAPAPSSAACWTSWAARPRPPCSAP